MNSQQEETVYAPCGRKPRVNLKRSAAGQNSGNN